jgi:hypothetical protein
MRHDANAEAASVRLTVGQRRAALDVLHDRGSYADMEALADALALAVLTAEDENSRRVVCVREPGAFYVFGPYATSTAAEKALESGLATREGARGGIFPLIPAPRAAKKAPAKRTSKAKATA